MFDVKSVKIGILARAVNRVFLLLTGVNLIQLRNDVHTLSTRLQKADAVVVTISDDLQRAEAVVDTLSRGLDKLKHFQERFRTRVYMSTPEFLPDSDSGKLSYGYKDSAGQANYRDFEDIFRGSEVFIKDRLRIYDVFTKKGDSVLEIGCGRGEFLELLSEKEVIYTGVDLDESMIFRCKEKALSNIVHKDFELYLDGVMPAFFDGIFSFQFIEHIPSEKIMDYFKKCHAALKPGGVVVVETVNPYSVEAFRTFHVDITHQKILYPEVLLYLSKAAGFREASIFYPNNTGFDESQYDIAGEYALIAYK